MAPDGAAVNVDLISASLRAEAADSAVFVEALAAKLEDALPGRVSVERRRRGLLGNKLVRKISVSAGGDRLELSRDDGDRVQTRRARVSGGIVLKTEPLEIDAWLHALGAALAAEAQQNEQTRRSLERLLLQ